MKLRKHIDENHNGNVRAFARTISKHRNQVDQWLKMGCIWLDGDVWQPKLVRAVKQ